MRFSEYLKLSRRRTSYSQVSLASTLSEIEGFEAIDNNTISRWERGRSTPDLSRQLAIIALFKDDPTKLIPFASEQGKFKSVDEAIEYIKSKLVSSLRASDQFLRTPDFAARTSFEIVRLSPDEWQDDLVALALDFDHSIYDTPYPVNIETVRKWASTKSATLEIFSYRGSYFGHTFALKLKEEHFNRLMDGTLEEAHVDETMFTSDAEDYCLHVFSILGMSNVVSALALLELIKSAISGPASCKKIGGICATKDSKRLAETLGFDLISIGPNADSSELRIHGRNVEWATYSLDLHSARSQSDGRHSLLLELALLA